MRLPRLPKLPPSRRKLRALLAETGNELDKAQAEVAAAKERLGEARRDARKLAEDRTDQRKASERRDELMAERDDARLRGIRAERERDKARHERDAVAREARKGWAKAAELAGQRDEERARRAELERAIREHHAALNGVGDLPPAGWTIHINTANQRLWRVLDGHEETPAERWQSPDEAGADARAHHRQERDVMDVLDDARLRFRAGEADGDH